MVTRKFTNTQMYLGIAGMLGPVIFGITTIILGLFQPGYRHIQKTVSALGEAGSSNPAIQSANFYLFGFLIMGLAFGLYRGINQGQGNKIGYLLLGIFGLVALILSGVFPADEGGATITFSGTAHQVVSGIGFPTGIASIFFIRKEMMRDKSWLDLAKYSLITGYVAIPLFIFFGSQISNPDAPLFEIAGLLQRVFIITLFQWFFVIGNRLRLLSVIPTEKL